MLGMTTLPERAVDTWLAAYLASQLPRVALWAPTQRTKVDFDMSVLGDGKLFVLEQKAPILHRTKTVEDHAIQIDVGHTRQLWRYCTDKQLTGLVWYVLPRPPYSAVQGAGRGASLLPEIAGARIAGHRWPGAGKGRPCQDWFHLVPAQSLYVWLHELDPQRMPPLPSIGDIFPGSPPVVGKRSFSCDELVMHGPQNTMTLAQWVSSVKDCSVEGGRVRKGRLVRIGRLHGDGEIIAEGREVAIPLDETPDAVRDISVDGDDYGTAARKQSGSPGSTRVVFVPRDDVPGWT
jgi:hypothetical protein